MTTPSATQIVGLLERDLIRKKEAPSGIFMREVGSPDGRRRADALFIQGVGGKGIDGYEIKVGRSDLAAELADVTKVDSWKRYCRRWWLVVPCVELLDGFDIPDDWGIKTPPTAKNRVAFTVVRPAAVLEPHDIGPALGRIATVWAYRMRDQCNKVRAAEVSRQQALADKAEMHERLAEAGIDNSPDTPHVVRARNLVEALYANGRYHALPDERQSVEALTEAVIDVLDGRSIKQEMARIAEERLRDLDRVTSEFGKSWAVKALRARIAEAADA